MLYIRQSQSYYNTPAITQQVHIWVVFHFVVLNYDLETITAVCVR
jgi:hypothetical protein